MKKCRNTALPGLPAVLLVCLAILAVSPGCEVPSSDKDESGDRKIDDVVVPIPDRCPCVNCGATERTVKFAGRTWKVRGGSTLLPPGPVCYSDNPDDIWVDGSGQLHLTIKQRDGVWVCSEVYTSGSFGYGTYIFHVAGRTDLLDRNAVLGLFTWDGTAPGRGHFSELDVELTRWGDESGRNIHYSVQPVFGPLVDGTQEKYVERTASRFLDLALDQSTHLIAWGTGRVVFSSYDGFGTAGAPASTWEFSGSNPARLGDGSYFTTPVVIPAPSDGSGVHLNLWLKDTDGDGYGNPPANGQAIEVVVQGFEFIR